MTGMRGTGSDSVVAEEVFVPEERFLSFARSAIGAYRRSGEGEALTRTPFPEGLMVPFIGARLGMGRAVYEQIVEKLRAGRPVVSAASPHARAVDAPGVQANVADAATLIDSAVFQAGRAADDIDRAARTGVALTPLAQARLRVDIGFAAQQIRQAVDLLLDVGGASRFDLSSPVRRIWRDLGTSGRRRGIRRSRRRSTGSDTAVCCSASTDPECRRLRRVEWRSRRCRGGKGPGRRPAGVRVARTTAWGRPRDPGVRRRAAGSPRWGTP
ncbi:hypothetical protein [Streptomyces sp. NPDC006638]|uniref:hypothetical protein n=1 Tax=Streptomyces sp. NPDC006638 TaxID=3157183 RepID=UPI0033A54D41